MDLIGIPGPAYSTNVTRVQLDHSRAALAARARETGAQLQCHYRRHAALLEVVPDTAETAGHFYRKAATCVPFAVRAGLPFVAVVISSPCSTEAAASRLDAPGRAEGDPVRPNAPLATMHTYLRFFAHFPNRSTAVCSDLANLGGHEPPCFRFVPESSSRVDAQSQGSFDPPDATPRGLL